MLHDAAADLVVTEHVTGPSLAEHLAAGDLAAVHLAGRAIARLHGAPVIVGPRRDLAGHVTDLIRPQPLALAAAVVAQKVSGPEERSWIGRVQAGLPSAKCQSVTGW